MEVPEVLLLNADFLDKENVIDIICLDFSKIFDTVPYGTLFVKHTYVCVEKMRINLRVYGG